MSLAPAARRASHVAVLLALGTLPAPLAAQHVVGADVNAAGEAKRDRAPVTFGSAYVVPAGARGISVQQSVSSGRESQLVLGAPGRVYRSQFASTVSAYWGVSSRVTVGGSVGFATTRAEYSWQPDAPGAPPGMATSYQSRATFEPFNLGAFARARLYASEGGATQVAANLSGQLSRGSHDANIPRYGIGGGLALAQRVGPLVLHLAPSAQVAEGRQPYAEVAGAIVFPILPRVTGSFETVYGGGGNRQALGTSAPATLEMGGGLRFDLGRVKLDLGHRQTTAAGSPEDSQRRGRIVLGTHVKF